MHGKMGAIDCSTRAQAFSQVEVAEQLNVGVVTYQRWEAGRTRPQPQHMRHLREAFETLLHQSEKTPSQETGSCSPACVPTTESSSDTTSVVLLAEDLDKPQTFIAAHMTTHLWSLAFLDHPTSHQKRSAIRQAIKDFDHMNTTNKNYQMNRREALCSLATLPMITLGLTIPGKTVQPTQYGSAVAQCSASVEACWELSGSSNSSDLLLAFQSASKYLSILETVAKHSSQYRQEALDLAVRYALLKAFLARHCVDLTKAIQCGKSTVALSKETENLSLQLRSHISLAWSYLFDKKYALALTSVQEGEACLLQYTQRPDARPFNSRIRGKLYSALALMQAKNGLPPDTSLGKASEIDLGDENNGFVDFKPSMLFLEAGWAYCYQGNQTKAMEWLEKRVDPKTLEPKITQSGLGRIETINAMTLSSFKAKSRDMEQIIHFWISGIQGAIVLQSEQRFNEALTNYELMEVVWPDEQRITDLRDYLVHWKA